VGYGSEKWQWAMLVKVLHGPAYGHRIEMETRIIGRSSHVEALGSWRGVGIPEGVILPATAYVTAALHEHLITRYGIRDELPLKWSGEPDPF
jgi:hypothetical protein